MKAKISAKVKIILCVIICAVLLIPIPAWYKDGGTFELNAVLWSVRKEHSISWEDRIDGYNIGTIVRVLLWKVYDDVKFVPESELQ
ncbi:MAG: hypothetical protein K2N38_06335 [Oscillospiraceae bacterium]|nr:hypothetical protein [Oscillospiraceae bacterium]